ncbi:MAG: universal stress protein [Paracoccaceae bacterium]
MYKHILVPIALDHRPNTTIALKTARFLKAEGGKITAVHAIEPIPNYAAHAVPDELREVGRKEAQAALVAELGGVKDVSAELINGSAGRAITDFAQANGVDCIVVASHQPGIQDYFLGSTAARVVRHAKCAVHVVR